MSDRKSKSFYSSACSTNIQRPRIKNDERGQSESQSSASKSLWKSPLPVNALRKEVTDFNVTSTPNVVKRDTRVDNNESLDSLDTSLLPDEVTNSIDSCKRQITNLQDVIKQNHVDSTSAIKELQAQNIQLTASVHELRDMLQVVVTEKEALSIPPELKRKVKTLYAMLPRDEKWNLDFQYTSVLNARLTEQFVKDAQTHMKDKYSENQTYGACRTYFYSLAKEARLKSSNPEKFKESLEEKKLRSRRSRLLLNRKKSASEEEKEILKDVTQELMSDEEDGEDGSLRIKSPEWRSRHLTDLLHDLDKRREEDLKSMSKLVVKKKRVVGESPIKRRPSSRVDPSMLFDEDEDY